MRMVAESVLLKVPVEVAKVNIILPQLVLVALGLVLEELQ